MENSTMEQNQLVCCSYILANRETSQIKIGATKCLSRRLWEHLTGLEGFGLEFYVPHSQPFIIERFLHKFIAENDLIIEVCQKREVYKCDIAEALEKLRQYISNTRKLVWYTTVYKNDKTAVLLRQPIRKDFKRHCWEGELRMNCDFSEYIRPDYFRAYYQNHREQIIETSKRYYENNKEKVKQQMREKYYLKKLAAISLGQE